MDTVTRGFQDSLRLLFQTQVSVTFLTGTSCSTLQPRPVIPCAWKMDMVGWESGGPGTKLLLPHSCVYQAGDFVAHIWEALRHGAYAHIQSL